MHNEGVVNTVGKQNDGGCDDGDDDNDNDDDDDEMPTTLISTLAQLEGTLCS